MSVSISGTSYNKPVYSTQNKQKPAQPTVDELQRMKLTGSGMSFERFKELMESDSPIEDKLAETIEAFGNIINKDALESDICAIKNGKMSIEEIYRRSLARSNMLTYSEDDIRTMMEKSQKQRRPHLFSNDNDPDVISKFQPINVKINSGVKLTAEEKSFLRKHYPEVYEKVIQAEQEAERIKKSMDNARTPQEAQQILMNAQITALSGNSQGSNFFLAQMLSRINSNDSGISMFDIQA